MLGSGLGPLPEIIPGARVGTGYVGLGETPGARVGWTNGAGVGTLGHSGTSQHASLGSTTILQPSGRLLKEGHLNKKKISKIPNLKNIQCLICIHCLFFLTGRRYVNANSVFYRFLFFLTFE